MAGSARSAAAKHAHRMFAPSRGAAAARGPGPGSGAAEEFDESDVWGSSFGPDVDTGPGAAGAAGAAELAGLAAAAARARPIPSSRAGGARKKPAADAPGSLPMNIPDWQKILGVEYRDHRAGEWEIDCGDDAGGGAYGGRAEMVPPHELAWRSRAASLSVHEGVGRTLKGRDLSRVRDAVWKKTGFED